jgi:tetraprenyl-beta-curcumene synthase
MASIKERASSLGLITRFVGQVFPLVDAELSLWRLAAGRASPELAGQAMASIRDKKFHCLGGGVYALHPGVDINGFVRLVVALQTISDYLDNLCDRAGITDETAFRQLHLAMTDALDPAAGSHDYYEGYPWNADGGYLAALVNACRTEVTKLPAYDKVRPRLLELATLYSELQTYKHLDPSVRDGLLAAWGRRQLPAFPGLSLWEYAAATGSTLGMFALCAAAAAPDLTHEAAENTYVAYFPWVCGLHILLDYFIDLAEDENHGDLNFVARYPSESELVVRLTVFREKALAAIRNLPQATFGETVVAGLLAMYLSDPKTDTPRAKRLKYALLANTGGYTRILYNLCRLLRRRGIL